MSETSLEYVEQTAEGGWRLTGTRVSFDSVIHGYREGRSPEAIVEDFPSLTVEQVYGSIAYYLKHRTEADRYLKMQSERWEQARLLSEKRNGPLLDRLRSGRDNCRRTPSLSIHLGFARFSPVHMVAPARSYDDHD